MACRISYKSFPPFTCHNTHSHAFSDLMCYGVLLRLLQGCGHCLDVAKGDDMKAQACLAAVEEKPEAEWYITNCLVAAKDYSKCLSCLKATPWNDKCFEM